MLNRHTLNAFWRLGRFDKPIGTVLLLFPCWWGVALESGINFSPFLLFLFLAGALCLRTAGCIVNDILDRDIDRRVTRTKTRPLAAGELSVTTACIFMGFFLILGFIILLQLPSRCWGLSLFFAGLAALYPLSKRVIPCPQLVLGFAFNSGILIGAAAVTPHWFHPASLFLYGAGILWTVAYDTIYALQDREDDQNLNIGSTALLFGSYVKPLVGLCYIGMHMLLGIVLFLISSEFSPFLGYGCILLSLGLSLYKLIYLDPKDPPACRHFFIANQWIGMLVFLALLS